MEDSEHTHKKAWFDLSLKGLFWPCSGEKSLGNRGGGGGSSEASDVSQAGWWRMERRWGALLLLFSFSVASDSATLGLCNPPGSSVHGVPQASIVEWAAIPLSRGSSPPRNQTCISYIGRRILYH